MTKAIKLKPIERLLLERVALGEKPTHVMRALDPNCTRPDVRASKILARPHVREARARMEDDALATAGVTRAWIVNELRKIASANLYNDDGTPKDIDKLDEDTRAAVGSIEVERLFGGRGEGRKQTGTLHKVKLWNKREALSELAAIAGLKRDSGAPPVVIGPGLTVIVQQSVHAAGPAQVGQQSRVVVNLPPPERS